MGGGDSLNHRETVVHGRGQLQLRRANAAAWRRNTVGQQRANAEDGRGFKEEEMGQRLRALIASNSGAESSAIS